MNEIREIVTRAVVGRGKKIIRQSDTLTASNEPYSILGCWVINHDFEGKLHDDVVTIDGTYEIDIWYSYESNTKTDIARQQVSYTKTIKTRQIANDINKDCREILIQAIQEPTVTNASINEDTICVDICFELLVEVIGETKIKVQILEQVDYCDFDDEDFENEIDEDFIHDKD